MSKKEKTKNATTISKEPCFVIAEIGINHNGDIKIAKELIDVAHSAGADAVKFQKRTVDIVYSQEYLDSFRESPWGNTQRHQKEGLEFGKAEYDEIDAYCKNICILHVLVLINLHYCVES